MTDINAAYCPQSAVMCDFLNEATQTPSQRGCCGHTSPGIWQRVGCVYPIDVVGEPGQRPSREQPMRACCVNLRSTLPPERVTSPANRSSSADHVIDLRRAIGRARSHLSDTQAERAQLKDLQEQYERGKDDYLETIEII